METTTKSIGRPSKYNPEIARVICERLSTTRRGLEDICRDADLPCAATVWNWLNKHIEFLEMYMRAREFQTELMYDELEIITNAPLPEADFYDALGNFLGRKIDAGAAMAEMQRRKLQIDVIKFKLVKLQAKRFGERKDIDLNVKVNHSVSSEQYRQLLATAAAVPQIAAPEDDRDFTDAEVVHEVRDDDMTAEEFDELMGDDDYLG